MFIVCISLTGYRIHEIHVLFLQVQGSQTEYLCTFFVEGVAIADARGRKRFLKQKEKSLCSKHSF